MKRENGKIKKEKAFVLFVCHWLCDWRCGMSCWHAGTVIMAHVSIFPDWPCKKRFIFHGCCIGTFGIQFAFAIFVVKLAVKKWLAFSPQP